MSLRALFVFLIIFASACAPENGHQAVDSITASILHKHIAILASDEFGGRAPFSEGEKKTLDYLVSEFRRMGLKPGNADSYLQAVPLSSTTITSSPVLLIKGGSGPQRFSTPEQFVVRNPRISAGVNLTDIEIVFAGYGISAPEFSWHDYENLDVNGKLVIVLVNDPGYATRDPRLFNGNAMTWYGRWPYKYDEATRHGATGVLVVHETGAAGYPLGNTGELNPPAQFYHRQRNCRKIIGLGRMDHHGNGPRCFLAGRPGFRRTERSGKTAGLYGPIIGVDCRYCIQHPRFTARFLQCHRRTYRQYAS